MFAGAHREQNLNHESDMDLEGTIADGPVDIRALIGLTRGLPAADIESLVVEGIGMHRRLVRHAQGLFEALPEPYRNGEAAGGPQHLEYVRATIDMHAQMSVVTTLLQILGYTPTVPK